MLWRIQNGEASGINPRLVWLAIGVNNVWDWSVPEIAVANGVKTCVASIRKVFPATKVVVVNLFPSEEKADAPNRFRNRRIHDAIANLKLDKDKNVKVADFGHKFLTADGALPKAIMPDSLHPNAKGYKLFAAEMKPIVEQMLR